jgi:O-antigen/teichoic acid export membrane protein
MISETTEHPRTHAAKPHATFFRQSGWLMIAGIAGGLMGFGVHFLSNKIPPSQYTIFQALLMVTTVLPTTPLQMIFAQQTAAALATNRTRQLAGMIRVAFLSLFLVWLVVAVFIFIFQAQIVTRLALGSALPLWITLLMILLSLWAPMLGGVLQGKQDFFTMGWSAILGGVIRLGVAAALVIALGGGAAGMMTGALVGMMVVAGIAIWQTRDLWSLPREKFDGRSLLGEVLPLMFGFGVFQFMFASDTIFAKAFFSSEEMATEMASYSAAGTLSRALLWLVLPLAAVMFPKIVHSNAKSEKSNLLKIVLLGTAVLTIFGGLGLSLTGQWVIKWMGVWPAKWLPLIITFLPWYSAAMVPLALANVLVNDLMARKQFRVVPAIVLVAVAYGVTLPYILNHYPQKLETVLQTLGVFNVLLLGVCAWAAFGNSKSEAPSETLKV